MEALQGLIDEVFTAPARGRRPRKQEAVVIGDLTPADIEKLNNVQPGQLQQNVRPLQRLRHSHHMLAQLLAQGVKDAEAALVTGYDPQYISNLKKDPAFANLVSHYASVRDEVNVDVLTRLKSIGIDSVDELQQRLVEHPERFSSRELMELAALGFDRSGFGPQAQVKHSGVVALVDPASIARMKVEAQRKRVGSVSALPSPSSPQLADGRVIDVEPVAETSGPWSESQGVGISAESRQVLITVL